MYDNVSLPSIDRKEVVFESDYFRVIHAPAASSWVCITFNEMGSSADGTSFWGDEFLTREGISAIGFMSKRPNWFPRRPMMDAIDAARPLLTETYSKVATYGFSQGAYAALAYSRLLGAELSLAFSPQISIAPADVAPWDTRYAEFYDPDLNADMLLTRQDLGGRHLVFFDPLHDWDRRHAEMIARTGPVDLVRLLFVEHDTVRFAAEGRFVGRLLRSIEGAALSSAEVRRLARQARAQTPTYWTGRWRVLSHRRPGSVAAQWRAVNESLRLRPAHADTLIHLAKLHLDAGAQDDAKAAMDQARRFIGGATPYGRVQLWTALNRTGQREAAAALMSAAIGQDPRCSAFRLHLASSLIDLQQPEAALEQLVAVETSLARVTSDWHQLSIGYKRLGRGEDAMRCARRMREINGPLIYFVSTLLTFGALDEAGEAALNSVARMSGVSEALGCAALLRQAGAGTAATACLHRARELAPDSFAVRIQLAEDLLRTGSTEAAKAEVELLGGIAGDAPEAAAALTLYKRLGESAQARALAIRILDAAPVANRAEIIAAATLVGSDAALVTRHVERLAASDFGAHEFASIWNVARRCDRADVALELARRSVARWPADAWVRVHLVTSLIEAGVQDEAAEHLIRAADHPDPDDRLSEHIARSALQVGLHDIALASGRRLLATHPGEPRALLIIAEAKSAVSGEPILLEVFEAVSSPSATVAHYAQAREVLRKAGLTTSLGQLAEVMLRARPRPAQEVLSIIGPLDSTDIALIREFAPHISADAITQPGQSYRLARMLEWSGFPDEAIGLAEAAIRRGDASPAATELYTRLTGRRARFGAESSAAADTEPLPDQPRSAADREVTRPTPAGNRRRSVWWRFLVRSG